MLFNHLIHLRRCEGKGCGLQSRLYFSSIGIQFIVKLLTSVIEFRPLEYCHKTVL
jgi:hypothetical protein